MNDLLCRFRVGFLDPLTRVNTEIANISRYRDGVLAVEPLRADIGGELVVHRHDLHAREKLLGILNVLTYHDCSDLHDLELFAIMPNGEVLSFMSFGDFLGMVMSYVTY